MKLIDNIINNYFTNILMKEIVNKINEIKIFMYDGFDFSNNKAYLHFELSDGKQYNDISATKSFKLNETYIEEEQCFYYVLPQFILKQPGKLSLTVRISPLSDIEQIDNSSLITTQIYYAIFGNGEEVIEPDTVEILRQDIANVEISTQASAQEYVRQLASTGAFDGPPGPPGPPGATNYIDLDNKININNKYKNEKICIPTV